MIDTAHFGLFVLAGILLNLTPGPDVLLIVSQSLRGGFRAGVAAALGITAGCFVHLMAAALGLAALLAASATAFNVLKWTGAAYLVWTGLRHLLSSALPEADEALFKRFPSEVPVLKRVFFRGFATNVLNPKVALFFLAFVPQFIPAHSADPARTFVVLGCLFNFNGLLICLMWAWAAAWLSRHAHRMGRVVHKLDRLAGILFVSLGLQLAFAEAP